MCCITVWWLIQSSARLSSSFAPNDFRHRYIKLLHQQIPVYIPLSSVIVVNLSIWKTCQPPDLGDLTLCLACTSMLYHCLPSSEVNLSNQALVPGCHLVKYNRTIHPHFHSHLVELVALACVSSQLNLRLFTVYILAFSTWWYQVVLRLPMLNILTFEDVLTPDLMFKLKRIDFRLRARKALSVPMDLSISWAVVVMPKTSKYFLLDLKLYTNIKIKVLF